MSLGQGGLPGGGKGLDFGRLSSGLSGGLSSGFRSRLYDDSGGSLLGAGDSRPSGGLLVGVLVGANGRGIKTTALGSSGNTLAVVGPEIELVGAGKALLEQVLPLGIVAVALGLGTQDGVAYGKTTSLASVHLSGSIRARRGRRGRRGKEHCRGFTYRSWRGIHKKDQKSGACAWAQSQGTQSRCGRLPRHSRPESRELQSEQRAAFFFLPTIDV